MTARYMQTLFTPAVVAEQEAAGSRASYARAVASAPAGPDPLGPREAAFVNARDSFYLASVSASGWPYVQHRGGPPGFLKVLDPGRIGFADYRGNRQYVSLGNVRGDDRVALFLIDYPRRARLKLLGRMAPVVLADDPALAQQLLDPGYGATAERGYVIAIHAFDWNCPQHITPRYTLAEVEAAVAPLHERIAALEAELARRRAT